MTDKFFEEYTKKELELAEEQFGNLDKKMQLQDIIKEGFINTGKMAGYLHIYELDDERVFYDKYKDRIACRFDLKDLMTKL